jgi:hypothetical protein
MVTTSLPKALAEILMIHRILIPLTLASAILLPVVVEAQVSVGSRALSNTSVVRQGQNYRYEYRLVHGSRPGDILSDVLVDVSSPASPSVPGMLRGRGTFLFDALAEEDFGVGHPPLGVETPERWSAAIYYTGSLSWGSLRHQGGANAGLRRGESLDGFALVSPALPAYRAYRVIPFRPLASVHADPAPIDSTWAILSGYVLAPGWMPGEVTAAYLREQVEGACWFQAVGDCSVYRILGRRIQEAEALKNDRGFRDAVGALRRQVSEDSALTRVSRLVLESTIQALERRPPSRRD